MAVAATDLIFYASANMTESDSGTTGGAIDTTTRVVPASSSLFNSLNDTVEILSSNAGDTTQTVTIYGRNAGGSIVNEPLSLNGTTVVNGATTFERILKVVVSASHTGTITIRKATGDTTICSIESGVLTIRTMFYDCVAEASGGSTKVFYEKCFLKNTHGTLSALGLTISEASDSGSIGTFAIEDAVNDNGTSTNRVTAPTGITGDGFSGSSKTIPGTDLAAGSAIGIWVAMTVTAGLTPSAETYGVGFSLTSA